MSSDFSQNHNYYEEVNDETPELEHSVLDDVLKATMSSDEALSLINARTHEGFLKVAREFSGQELTLDPVGIALVRAVLGETLGGRIVNESQHENMVSDIAASLFENPTASARLSAFWGKLQEAIA